MKREGSSEFNRSVTEVVRRKWLEANPEASSNDDPVVFETSTIPWWAWVKRFHLPEAELLNGTYNFHQLSDINLSLCTPNLQYNCNHGTSDLIKSSLTLAISA